MRSLRRWAVAATALAGLALPATPAAGLAAPRRHCPRLFTVAQGERAARAVFRGTRRVPLRDFFLLGRLEACQRNPAARWFVRWYDRRERRRHAARVRAADPSRWPSLIASVYEDGGQTSSGWHAAYGFAACGTDGWCPPIGARVEFCYGASCAVGVRDDSGPYVGGRDVDLSTQLAAAIGFPYGVAAVRYHVLR
jgi:hypothetical protein